MKIIRFLIILFAASALCACSAAPVKQGADAVVVGGVPFFPQEDYQCGPASMAGVLHYWGSRIGVDEIAGDIFSKSARGTLTIDMVLYAERKGYSALQYKGGMDDLRARIKEGYPLIVMVDYGFFVYQQDHFMVVIGYDENGVIVNSGRSEKLYVPNEDFIKTWERTHYWTLWIKPKGKNL